MIRGVDDPSGPYLLVSISRMLSAPLNPAKGWVFGNSASFTSALPARTSTSPTNLNTFPRVAASTDLAVILASTTSPNRAMNSSASTSSSSRGTKLSTLTSSKLIINPDSRAAMTTFLATSMPFRSSRGSGSVYPAPFACDTICEKGELPSHVLKRKDMVPLNTPRIVRTSSPVASNVRNVDTTGNPAPMVDSTYHFPPPSDRVASMHCWYRFSGPEFAFLFGVATCHPLDSQP
mmetsp:Transcript_40007/g.96253  ORF Transcript_40007/g.96253 Transcript_40007/m.96253 type:complete len:234 (-) Transcript_40007:696-1397(-)